MLKVHQKAHITAHQLAHILLAMPDVPVMYPEKETDDPTVNFLHIHSAVYNPGSGGEEYLGSITIDHCDFEERLNRYFDKK